MSRPPIPSSSEKAQIAQAAEASKAAYDAWKDAKARGESKDHVDDLLDKAMQASEVEKGLQDLCD
jgi:hypothetical protein